MAFMQFSCPSCGVVLRVADSTPANAPIRCPKCNERFRVPAPDEANAPILVSVEPNPSAPRSPMLACKENDSALQRIQHPAPKSRAVLWIVLGVMGVGVPLLAVAVILALFVWQPYFSSKPAAQVTPPMAGQQFAPFAPPMGRAPVQPAAQDKTAIQWLAEGNRLRTVGDVDAAIQAYTHAIEKDPRMAAAYTNRGLTRSDKGDFDGGIADCTKSIELNPNDPFPFINRANARIRKGVDPDASIADARRALELRPGIPAALVNLGMARDLKGDYNGAIAEFDKALNLLPTFELAYVQRGQTWQKMKKWDLAEADFTHALELNFVHPDIYQHRGTCRLQQSNREGAIEDFTEALKLDPNQASLYYHRSRAFFESGDLKAAQADLDKALLIQKKLIPLHTLRIKILLFKGDGQGALAVAERLVTDHPKSTDALLCRAGVRAWRGEDDKARADYAAALALDPKSIAVHLLGGWFYLGIGQADEAAKAADAGLKLTNRNHPQTPYLLILAHCARRKRHPDAARAVLTKAGKKGGAMDWPEPILNYLHGDLSAEKLLEDDADNDRRTEAHAYVGIVLWQSGAIDEARKHFQWVRAHGNRDFLEYDLAELLLHRLDRTGAAKP